MCGIAGVMWAAGHAPQPGPLRAMEATLLHRGPDGTGNYRSGDVAMVQTRLAIIDLATGNQPLYDSGGTALIANAEIYNYIELRAALGGTFATHSDCEPPLHLYRKYGLDFARHLRGMYAVALHDPVAGRLVLARDPFGIKPLYYAETSHGFVFASEPRSLLASGLIAAALVPQARNELLQLQFTTGRSTIFHGISRVLPGETIVVAQGRVVERRRIEALPADDSPGPPDEPAALAALDAVLVDSVRLHQRSDVPYGMFLSGGIDSSTVLGVMARLNERPVHALTVGFSQGGDRDERAAARVVARALGAEHQEVELREADFWCLLPEIAYAMDDPAADYAIVPTYKLAAVARAAGLKVILSGEGGDELFAGYGRYRSALRPWWAGGRQPRSRGNLDKLGLLRDDLVGWRDGVEAAELAAARPGRSRLQVAQAADCSDWLPNDLLTKLDRCLMAHGVEGRTPFLYPAVAAFAFRLPDALKVQKGLGKWLLRRWLATHLPAAEPMTKKRGFTVPVGGWLARRGAQLGALVASQPGISEICAPGAVESLFRHLRHRHHAFAAWTLLFYALWHRCHIEQRAPAPDVFATLALRA